MFSPPNCSSNCRECRTHRNKRSGLWAEPFSDKEGAMGIEWVIERGEQHNLPLNARKKAVQEFDFALVAERYIELYSDVLTEAMS